MPRNGISGSYGSFIPNFIRNLRTVLHSGCVNLYSCLQYQKVPFSLHPFQHLLLIDILMMAILTSVKWYITYFIVVLTYISLKMSNVKHLFMCLLVICMSSLEKCLFRSSVHFLMGDYRMLKAKIITLCCKVYIHRGRKRYVNIAQSMRKDEWNCAVVGKLHC